MKSQKLKIAVIMGGKSAEHEVSLASGKAVLKNIDKKKYNVLPIVITKKGIWTTSKTRATLDTLKKIQGIDLALIMLHGSYGEDGTIQGLFEMLNIPYTGAGVLSSALSMNKLKTKEIMLVNNILIPKYVSFSKSEWLHDQQEILKKIIKKLSFPCVVKPNDLGSSIGISIPKNKIGLAKACKLALKYSNQILVEKYIRGREIHCGVLGNEEPIALPLDEVFSKNEFYDYEAKYKKGMSLHQAPANLPKNLTRKIQNQAIKIYKLVLCRGMARVDFFVRGEKIYFNEINTIPGFTETSILPKEAKILEISFTKLIDLIIGFALKR
jgi:D-alanine-D-alanine ligase